MNIALVAGCSLGGLTAGGFLNTITGRIVPPMPEPPPAEAGGSSVAVAAPAVAVRVPSRIETLASALLTALWFGLCAARLGAVPALGAYCALGAGLVAVAVVDARATIVPRAILFPTLGALAVGLLGASADGHHWGLLTRSAIGGTAAFAVFFGLWWFFPRGLGYGDVRLAGVIGAALGWIGFGELYVGFLAAVVTGTAVGVVLMVRQGTGRKTKLPFGPPLVVGAAVGVLWGPWLVHLWLTHR